MTTPAEEPHRMPVRRKLSDSASDLSIAFGSLGFSLPLSNHHFCLSLTNGMVVKTANDVCGSDWGGGSLDKEGEVIPGEQEIGHKGYRDIWRSWQIWPLFCLFHHFGRLCFLG